MVKEAKNIDFYTTGKQPTNEDFAKISEWIKQQKEALKRKKRVSARRKNIA